MLKYFTEEYVVNIIWEKQNKRLKVLFKFYIFDFNSRVLFQINRKKKKVRKLMCEVVNFTLHLYDTEMIYTTTWSNWEQKIGLEETLMQIQKWV